MCGWEDFYMAVSCGSVLNFTCLVRQWNIKSCTGRKSSSAQFELYENACDHKQRKPCM